MVQPLREPPREGTDQTSELGDLRSPLLVKVSNRPGNASAGNAATRQVGDRVVAVQLAYSPERVQLAHDHVGWRSRVPLTDAIEDVLQPTASSNFDAALPAAGHGAWLVAWFELVGPVVLRPSLCVLAVFDPGGLVGLLGGAGMPLPPWFGALGGGEFDGGVLGPAAPCWPAWLVPPLASVEICAPLSTPVDGVVCASPEMSLPLPLLDDGDEVGGC